ncbi:MAG: hypothetical protein H7245_18135 [Candidatus Saccharibacteria bacterium]|nr:hypothetical protein [Pseudorhodobacter sp.]
MTDAPILTLPEEEAAALRAAYQAAAVILEYGSGGSTLVAADLPGRRVFAVESAVLWMARMQVWFQDHPPKANVVLHHGDIGKTRDWGFPADTKTAGRWSAYPLSVWDRPDFAQPDVVLIDGRFRLACALTVLFRSLKPVTVLIDDYIDRPGYKKIETLVGAPLMAGRMAQFLFTPRPLPAAQMAWIMAAYANPN